MADDDTDRPDNDQPDNDDPDGNDQPDDVDDDAGEDPASIKAERDKLRSTLRKIKAERGRLTKELADAKKGTANPNDDAETKATRRLQRAGGIAALMESGLPKDSAKILVRLIDMDGVDFDEDGDGDFSDEIDRLKSALPALFQPARTARSNGTRPPAGGRDQGSTIDKTTEAMLRAAGYR